jgi:hypothetical protein
MIPLRVGGSRVGGSQSYAIVSVPDSEYMMKIDTPLLLTLG